MTTTRKIACALILLGAWIAVAGYAASTPSGEFLIQRMYSANKGGGGIPLFISDLRLLGLSYGATLAFAVTLIFTGVAAIVFEDDLKVLIKKIKSTEPKKDIDIQ